MNRKARAFLWIFLLFLIQNASDSIFSGAPPLVLIGVIVFAFLEGPSFGLAIGCWAGIFLEIFGVGRIGTQIALLGSLGLVSGFVSSKIFRESLWIQTLFPVVANYVLTLINLLPSQSLSQEGSGIPIWRQSLTLSAPFLTALVSPAIFWLLEPCRFHRVTGAKEEALQTDNADTAETRAE